MFSVIQNQCYEDTWIRDTPVSCILSSFLAQEVALLEIPFVKDVLTPSSRGCDAKNRAYEEYENRTGDGNWEVFIHFL